MVKSYNHIRLEAINLFIILLESILVDAWSGLTVGDRYNRIENNN